MLYLIAAIVVVVAVVVWDLRRSAKQKRALASGNTNLATHARSGADAAARAARETAKGTAMGNNQDGGHNNAITGPHRG